MKRPVYRRKRKKPKPIENPNPWVPFAQACRGIAEQICTKGPGRMTQAEVDFMIAWMKIR